MRMKNLPLCILYRKVPPLFSSPKELFYKFRVLKKCYCFLSFFFYFRAVTFDFAMIRKFSWIYIYVHANNMHKFVKHFFAYGSIHCKKKIVLCGKYDTLETSGVINYKLFFILRGSEKFLSQIKVEKSNHAAHSPAAFLCRFPLQHCTLFCGFD